MRRTRNVTLFLVVVLSVPTGAAPAQRNRVTERVDSNRRAILKGHAHPMAVDAIDEGPADSGFVLPRLTIVLKPSDSQQAERDRLLAEQQDPASPNYHHWLSPEEYADRFGVSQDDMDKIA